MEIDITGWGLALAGGMLIGTAATVFLFTNQKIMGISGIWNGLIGLHTPMADRIWRLAFVLGVVAGGGIVLAVAPQQFGPPPSSNPAVLVAAGLLVGIGTRMGRGCTSGHGVCGISRLSGRSIVATLTFTVSGMVTVAVARLLNGGTW